MNEVDQIEDTIFLNLPNLRNPNFTILVRLYLFNQYRIQITDKRCVDAGAPAGHGEIVQNFCTYNDRRMIKAVRMLRTAEDPLALAKSWERPWNSEGGRIRLDNEPPAGESAPL